MRHCLGIFSSILICCMLAGGARFPIFRIFLQSMKAKFRTEVLSAPDLQVSIITMHKGMLYHSSKGIEWVDENKELVVNGIFNEVVRIVVKGDSAEVHLVEDRHESRLYSQFLQSGDSQGQTLTLYQLLVSFQATLPRVQTALYPGVNDLLPLGPGVQKLLSCHIPVPVRPPLV